MARDLCPGKVVLQGPASLRRRSPPHQPCHNPLPDADHQVPKKLHYNSAKQFQRIRNVEPPRIYERLLQDNSSLKTRVTELEVISDLYRSTIGQYEQGGALQAEIVPQPVESQLKQTRDQALRREEALKGQVKDKNSTGPYIDQSNTGKTDGKCRWCGLNAKKPQTSSQSRGCSYCARRTMSAWRQFCVQ